MQGELSENRRHSRSASHVVCSAESESTLDKRQEVQGKTSRAMICRSAVTQHSRLPFSDSGASRAEYAACGNSGSDNR